MRTAAILACEIDVGHRYRRGRTGRTCLWECAGAPWCTNDPRTGAAVARAWVDAAPAIDDEQTGEHHRRDVASETNGERHALNLSILRARAQSPEGCRIAGFPVTDACQSEPPMTRDVRQTLGRSRLGATPPREQEAPWDLPPGQEEVSAQVGVRVVVPSHQPDSAIEMVDTVAA